MSTTILRRRPRRRAAATRLGVATIACAVGISGLVGLAGPASADTASSADGATATVIDAVAVNGAIHVSGTGWTAASGGSVIAVKLDGGSTAPVAGPPTNPATGQPTDPSLGIWAAIGAESNGAFSADLTFPTPTNSSPAVDAAAWGVGTTHTLRLLTGVLKSGDTARSVLLTFTVSSSLSASATTATTNAVTVAVSGSGFTPGEVLSVKDGETSLLWTVQSGRTSTTSPTYTVPAAGTVTASVVFAAGTKRAGDVTLAITGTQGTDRSVTAQVPPAVSFDPGAMVGVSGTMKLTNLVAGAQLSSVTLGDATLATGLTADADGVATAPYAIGDMTPTTLPLVVAQTVPDARTYQLTQAVYPDETPKGTDLFDLTSKGGLYQGLYQSAYSAAADALFVTASDRGTGNGGYIYKLDPDTLEVEASYNTVDHDGFTKTGAFGIAVDDERGHVWVSNTGSGSVAIYEQDDLSLVKQFPASTISHPRDVVVDPATDLVFVSSASEGSSASSTGYISVFEADDEDGDETPYEKVTDVQTGTRDVFNPVSLTLGDGKVFSPSLGSNKVAVIDTTALTASFLEISGVDVGGRGASGIAYDAADDRLFIASQNSNEVVIADATTGATLKEVPTGRQALNVVFDQVRGLAYVANFGGTSVSVLDGDGTKIASLPISIPNHVSLDGAGNAYAVDKTAANKVWKISLAGERVLDTAVENPTVNGVTGSADTTPLTVTTTYGEPIHLSGTGFRVANNSSGSTIAVKPASVQGSPTIATIDADAIGRWSADIAFPADWVAGDTQHLRLLTGALKTGDKPRSIAVKVHVEPGLQTGSAAITGTAQVGRTLTATAAGWPAGSALAFQWARDGVAIPGATAAAYAPVAADVKHRLSVTVTSVAANYTDGSATSVAVAVKAGVLHAVKPKVSGTAKAGKKLKVVTGTWTAGTALKVQWLVNGKAVKGATGKTLKVTKAMKGKKVTVRVTGTKAGYTTVTVVSAATKVAKK